MVLLVRSIWHELTPDVRSRPGDAHDSSDELIVLISHEKSDNR